MIIARVIDEVSHRQRQGWRLDFTRANKKSIVPKTLIVKD